MATTQLMGVVNRSGVELKIDFLEHDKHDAHIAADHAREFFYPPIPWCSSNDEFKSKGLLIIAGSTTFSIWQQDGGNDGDHVRCSTSGWQEPATANRIPGESGAGGQIVLVVSSDSIRSYRLDWFRK
jgi:hypothetical protein